MINVFLESSETGFFLRFFKFEIFFLFVCQSIKMVDKASAELGEGVFNKSFD